MNLYNKNVLRSLLSWMLASQALSARNVDLVRDEALIPFYAELNQIVETEAGTLAKGERVVVIRPESHESVRVEAPRKGIITLPVEVTNLTAEIERAKNADAYDFKQVPRMALFLANRIVSGESLWQHVIPADVIYSCERWVMLYGDASTEATKSAVVAASKCYEGLSLAEQKTTMFVFLDVFGNKSAIQQLANSVQPKIHTMPGYLSKGYARSLDHIEADSELPQLLEVAPSGRILSRANGLEVIIASLDQGLDYK